jgi:diguanylate cyclase (GGDEF)-like protein
MEVDPLVSAHPRFRIWLRPDGVVQLVWGPKVAIVLGDAIAASEAMAQLTGGRRSPLLVDMRDVIAAATRPANLHFGRQGDLVSAVAMLVASPLNRIAGNLFIGVSNAPFPTRLFESEASAVAWLLRDEPPVHDLERRLEYIASTIGAFAARRFDERATVGPQGDIVDAVAAGVNFLGEELGASFGEIERRVADRTVELEIATREFSRRALHDELTGLPNRALFWEHLSHRLDLADRRQTGFAVLFLDIDDFKVVNDTLGHAAGDQLLVDVASRLSAVLRVGDTAGRVGGDEFVALLDDVATSEAAMVVGRRLNEALRAAYEIGTDRIIATASIGVVVGPDDFKTVESVVAAADAAMYVAKRRGKGRCVLYSSSFPKRPDRRPVGAPA